MGEESGVLREKNMFFFGLPSPPFWPLLHPGRCFFFFFCVFFGFLMVEFGRKTTFGTKEALFF